MTVSEKLHQVWTIVLDSIDWKHLGMLQQSNVKSYCFLTLAGSLFDMNVILQGNYVIMKGSVGISGVDVPYEIKGLFSGEGQKDWRFSFPYDDLSTQEIIVQAIIDRIPFPKKAEKKVFLCEIEIQEIEYMGETNFIKETRLIRATDIDEVEVKAKFFFGCHDPYGVTKKIDVTVIEPVG